jgi:glycosyltransferase involved in cell wall biosynthesis
MRVLFLTLYPGEAASPRYRVTQFVPYLRAQGFDCTVAPPLTPEEWQRLTGPGRHGRALWYHAAETPRRLRQILEARHYDVVVVQKAIMTAYLRGFWGLLRRRARRIVYDIDDAVHLAPPHALRFPWRLLEDRAQVRRIMAGADLVLAGNAWLAEEALLNGARRVEHFPTVVDTARWTPPVREPETYTLGWIGSPGTTPHLAPVLPAIAQIAEARMSLVGADLAQLDTPAGLRVEWTPWSLNGEVNAVQAFSVGIMPLPQTPWVRGKCALKALLSMSCARPCVVTPFGAAVDIVRDDATGLYATTPQEWTDALERLHDPALRRRLGEAARGEVETNYSLHSAAPRLAALLESLR